MVAADPTFALAAQRAHEAAEEEVERLQNVLEPKRPLHQAAQMKEADAHHQRILAEKEKEFQKRLAKAKTHLPLAAILKGRRAAPPKEAEPKT